MNAKGAATPAIFLILALSSAFVVRAALGIRPYPSIDDFAYGPVALLAIDPSSFPADDILRGFAHHSVVYTALFALFEGTTGVATGFFWTIIALTALTGVAWLYVMRGLGASGAALPIALLLASLVRFRGIGRGALDGVMGDAVHMQWIAFILLLVAFGAALRGRVVRAGGWLGLTAFAHPMVAAQGAVALVLAALPGGRGAMRRIAALAGAALATGLPMVAYVIADRGTASGGTGWDAAAVVADAYRFRAPHHYELGFGSVLVVTAYAVLGLASLAVRRDDPARLVRARALGLFAGLGLLLLLAGLFYGPAGASFPGAVLLMAHVADLTRLSPIFVLLAASCFAAVLEAAFKGRVRRGRLDTLFLASAAGAAAGIGALNTVGATAPLALVALAGIGLMASRDAEPVTQRSTLMRPAVVMALTAATGIFALGHFVATRRAAASVPAPQAELFEWAAGTTPPEALFIIPPSMQEFRLYTQRSVYVDFKLFPVGQPALAMEVRERLERITGDSGVFRSAVGWDGILAWDSAYAAAPLERVAGLLRETDADYYVRPGVAPPADLLDVADLGITFDNGVYVVLTLR